MQKQKTKRHGFWIRKPHSVIRRVTFNDVRAVQEDEEVREFLCSQREKLGKNGNIVIRCSGIPTENYLLAEGNRRDDCEQSVRRLERLLIKKGYLEHEHEWEVLSETDYGEMDYSSYGAGTEHFVVTLYRCCLCGVLKKESRGDICGDPQPYLEITEEEYRYAGIPEDES